MATATARMPAMSRSQKRHEKRILKKMANKMRKQQRLGDFVGSEQIQRYHDELDIDIVARGLKGTNGVTSTKSKRAKKREKKVAGGQQVEQFRPPKLPNVQPSGSGNSSGDDRYMSGGVDAEIDAILDAIDQDDSQGGSDVGVDVDATAVDDDYVHVHDAKSNQGQNDDDDDDDDDPDHPPKQQTSHHAPPKKYPWRHLVPQNAIDPVTSNKLRILRYPPFAIVAAAPYVPIPVWPEPDVQAVETILGRKKHIDESADELKKANRQRARNQCGNQRVSGVNPHKCNIGRAFNLYDGRALAHFLVSRLQFVDPLTHRDLTRDEICNLDAYLHRHNFKDAAYILEAFDAKNATLTATGADATKAQHRTENLQRNAQIMLRKVLQQYQKERLQKQLKNDRKHDARRQRQEKRSANNESLTFDYHHQYPSLRASLPGLMPSMTTSSSSTLNPDAPLFRAGGSSSHSAIGTSAESKTISWANRVVLPVSAPPAISTMVAAPLDAPAPRSTTSMTSKALAVKAGAELNAKTGLLLVEEKHEHQHQHQHQHQQWEAHKDTQMKAAVAEYITGLNPVLHLSQDDMWTVPVPTLCKTILDEKFESRPNLSETLDGLPTSMRQRQQQQLPILELSSGWAPTGVSADDQGAIDDFWNESDAVNSPSQLIVSELDPSPLLSHLEKKWNTVLADDSSARSQFNSMEGDDFGSWKPRIEPNNAKPRRIHCVKLVDGDGDGDGDGDDNGFTPQPLLSEVSHLWRPDETMAHDYAGAAIFVKQTEVESAFAKLHPKLGHVVDEAAITPLERVPTEWSEEASTATTTTTTIPKSMNDNEEKQADEAAARRYEILAIAFARRW